MIFRPLLPWWALLIMFIPLIGLVGWNLWNHRHNHLWRWVRRAAMVLLLIAISVRPSLPGGTGLGGSSNFDVYFVVDTTSSMAAEDYNGDKRRLDGVKQDIKDLTTEFAGARFSVITFDVKANSELPLTTDTSAVTSIANTIVQEPTIYSGGSTISKPVELLATELKKDTKSSPERQRIIFYIGDGEQTSEEEEKSFKELSKYISGGAVLGYGTAEGGKMKERYGFEAAGVPTRWIMDYSIKDYSTNADRSAVSKIDENNLKAIASDLGVQYIHQTEPGQAQKIANTIGKTELQDASYDVDNLRDLYWIFAVALGILVLWEAWSSGTELHQALRMTRKQKK
jgi:Ca-activated chloride channel family protein